MLSKLVGSLSRHLVSLGSGALMSIGVSEGAAMEVVGGLVGFAISVAMSQLANSKLVKEMRDSL